MIDFEESDNSPTVRVLRRAALDRPTDIPTTKTDNATAAALAEVLKQIPPLLSALAESRSAPSQPAPRGPRTRQMHIERDAAGRCKSITFTES